MPVLRLSTRGWPTHQLTTTVGVPVPSTALHSTNPFMDNNADERHRKVCTIFTWLNGKNVFPFSRGDI